MDERIRMVRRDSGMITETCLNSDRKMGVERLVILEAYMPGGAILKNRRDEEEAHKHAFSPYPLAEAESSEEFYTPATAVNWEAVTSEELPLDRESFMLDIDRMVNEGLGGDRLRKITVILAKVQQIAWFENHMKIRKGV